MTKHAKTRHVRSEEEKNKTPRRITTPKPRIRKPKPKAKK
jgi:hypothetical protein